MSILIFAFLKTVIIFLSGNLIIFALIVPALCIHEEDFLFPNNTMLVIPFSMMHNTHLRHRQNILITNIRITRVDFGTRKVIY